MFSFIKKFFTSVTLDSYLGRSKDVKVSGIDFTIRKIRPLDHLNGSMVLTENYHVYEKADEKGIQIASEKLKKHYRDIFMSCVVAPALSRKENDPDGGLFVDRLFLDFEIANQLYYQIMTYTYGKKKVEKALKEHR